ncbi:MAG TPA: PqqD family peptide modification chaperone [Actinomycetota bacterium]|nr:PqqD family peptide modification chaperone [Actinomycetota bacterium]
MTIDADVEATGGLGADDIGMDFAPARREDVLIKELDGDLVLVNRDEDSVHVLNATAAIVWNCFDGESALSDIADDLADVFQQPTDQMRDDVLGITQWIGELGLLEGVVPTGDETPAGLAIGEELPTFALPAIDGSIVNLESLRGSQVLLVNWSPHCGFCERVAPELAAMQPALASRDVRMVFLSAGNAEDNRALLDSAGIQAQVLLREAGEHEIEDPFPAMGTPVAYLLDAEGRIAAPLAYGAGEVPGLAATAGGLTPLPTVPPQPGETPTPGEGGAAGEPHEHTGDREHEHAAGPFYIPAEGGVCGPGATKGKKPRTWTSTAAYAVGDYHIGVRADSEATDELLATVFAEFRLPTDTRAPDNYSVVLGGTSGKTRELSLLMTGDQTIVRSRSPRRVVRALAAQLSFYAAPEDDLLRTLDVAALVGERVVLLPQVTREWIEETQPRLAQLGIRLSDEPYSAIDTTTLELVIATPNLHINRAALDGLPGPVSTRSELPPIEPGRYQIDAWGIDSDEETTHPTRPQALAATWGALMGGQGETGELIDRMSDLFSRVHLVPIAFGDADQLVEGVEAGFLQAS